MIISTVFNIFESFKSIDGYALLTSAVLALVLTVFTFVYCIYRLIKKNPYCRNPEIVVRMVMATLTGFYSSCVFFSLLNDHQPSPVSGYLRLVPGTTVFGSQGMTSGSLKNIILFLPLGILLPLWLKFFRNIVATGLTAFLLTVTTEIAQRITKTGYFAVDDMILGTFGAVCGYLIYAYFHDGITAVKKRISADAAILSNKNNNDDPADKADDGYCVGSEAALIVLMLTAIAYMVYIILSFSSDPGSISRTWSRPLAYAVVKLCAIFNPTAQKAVGEITTAASLMQNHSEYIDNIEIIVRKAAHITEYAFLSFSVWIFLYHQKFIKKYIPYISCVLSVLVVGMVDEFNQLHIKDRSGSIRDVGIDLCGAVIVIVVTLLLTGRYYKKHCSGLTSN